MTRKYNLMEIKQDVRLYFYYDPILVLKNKCVHVSNKMI